MNLIDFGECEDRLKSIYNIDKNESLLVLKIDKNPVNENALFSQVEYSIFHPKNKSLLNLSLCQDLPISIFYNLGSNVDFDNLYKYNQSSDYYNDMCFTNNSNNGVDMIVEDRRDEFLEKNMSLCENDCILVDIDIEYNKSECKCNVKQEINLFNIKIDTEELSKNFKVEISSNIWVIKCYYLLFNKENLIKYS